VCTEMAQDNPLFSQNVRDRQDENEKKKDLGMAAERGRETFGGGCARQPPPGKTIFSLHALDFGIPGDQCAQLFHSHRGCPASIKA